MVVPLPLISKGGDKREQFLGPYFKAMKHTGTWLGQRLTDIILCFVDICWVSDKKCP